MGERVERGRWKWRERNRGFIESSYHDSAFGPGIAIRRDDGKLECHTGYSEWTLRKDKS